MQTLTGDLLRGRSPSAAPELSARVLVVDDEPLVEDLRELQRREGGTLGELVSRLLAEAIARRPKKPVVPAFEWTVKPMGALVDLADKDVVYAILDRADRAAEP